MKPLVFINIYLGLFRDVVLIKEKGFLTIDYQEQEGRVFFFKTAVYGALNLNMFFLNGKTATVKPFGFNGENTAVWPDPCGSR